MDDAGRQIEIFTPFGEAYALMKKILFQPFNLEKWLVLGFAAFISGSWGGGFNYMSNWNTRTRRFHGGAPWREQLPTWFWPALFIGGAAVLLVMVLLIWVYARGRFVFTDCIVRNRAAIVAPWREYRREGNSYFLFSLVITAASLVLFGIMAVPFFLYFHSHPRGGFILTVVVIGLIWIFFSVYFALVTQLLVPVMYRRRCRATEAFSSVNALILGRPGLFILFVLFCTALLLTFAIVSGLATCLTCCVAGLPYISSVVLLPAIIWLRGFVLCFLRQFGPDYDVWAAEPTTLPPPLPPLVSG